MRKLVLLVSCLVALAAGLYCRAWWVQTRDAYWARVHAADAPSGRPFALRSAPRAPDAQTQPHDGMTPSGNTDGGHLPWNGGDLYMADYSPHR